MPDLTPAQIERLLSFRGYGNPSGRFWFVGMEEGGGDLKSLQIRVARFAPLEDLAESHRNFASHDMSRLISTWRIMSAIVGRIGGRADWWDSGFAKDYQIHHLGRLEDDMYLTEVLPLPKRSLRDWPYGSSFESPGHYLDKVYPNQLASLRQEYSHASPKPQFVFCYGKKYWTRHREIFNFGEYRSALSGKIQWSRNESTVVILTNFFGYGWTGFSERFVDALCEFTLSKSPK